MNQALVDQVANAVLYEGYLLYPYRPSSVKNRQRWTFGGLCPQSHSLAQAGAEPWLLRTECLVLGGPRAVFQGRIRFLHLLERTVGELTHPVAEWPETGEPPFRLVETLSVGARVFRPWQEAVEREVVTADLTLAELAGQPYRHEFAFPPSRQLEPLHGPTGEIIGVFVRCQRAIAGAVEVSARPPGEGEGEGLCAVTVQVFNDTAPEKAEQASREEALLQAFVSAHAILGVREGEFVSLIDPPESCRAAVAECRNVGVWPVLVGEEGAKDALLCSPIILYDYPQIAPESPGDLFDATEIDEILTLRILTLTEAEKREMAALNERARALLDRTEALAGDQLRKLHGAVRSLRPVPKGERP